MTSRKRIEIFEGSRGGFFWRARDKNGKIVADGSEAYASRSNARRAARSIVRSLFLAPVIDIGSAYNG